MSVPRGFRNNNPGNLIDSKIVWKGESGKNLDSKFEEFNTMEEGVRAMILVIKHYIIKDKKDNIDKIIRSYAPSNENNTEKYIDSIEILSDIKKDVTLNFDKETMAKLVNAMVYVENGRSLPSGIFEKAWSLL